MKKLIQIKIATILILILPSMQGVSEGYTASTSLAEVNGKIITLGHIIAAIEQLPQEYNNIEPSYLLEGVLDQIVKQEIMAQSLDMTNILITTSLENELRSIKAKYAVDEQMQGYPTANQVQAAYKEATSSVERLEEFNASHILLDSEIKAQETLNLLESGADFSKLAQEKSTGPSGPNGGKLGWFGLGQMVPEFEAAVIVLEIGNVSQPVKTKFGWHLIKLNERRLKSVPTLKELELEIVQRLRQTRVNELVEVKTNQATTKLFNKAIDPKIIRNLELLNN